jgi:threonine/homoserine/homoserine lactone efflux protein
MDFPLATLATFALTSLVIELTPGPNMVYLAILTVSEGRRAGFAAVVGVALGLLILGTVAAFGFGALALKSPAFYQAMRWAGVGYLLWLAWDGWRDAGATTTPAIAKTSRRRHFARGFITNMLNPKAGIFYVALLPNFVDVSQPIPPQAIFLSVVYVIIATIIHALVVTLAGTTLPLLEDKRRKRIIRQALALALAAVAVWLAWSTR